jgi:hypothetical protein
MVNANAMHETKAREYLIRFGYDRALAEARQRLRQSVTKKWFWKLVCERIQAGPLNREDLLIEPTGEKHDLQDEPKQRRARVHRS